VSRARRAAFLAVAVAAFLTGSLAVMVAVIWPL
jgi:hypothetical protein